MNLRRQLWGNRGALGSRRPSIQQSWKQRPQERGARLEEGNVTRQNFWSSFERFKARLTTADFVAFDLELSGIHCVPPVDSSDLKLASPLHRSYHHVKHLAEKFAVLQVGLALFTLDPVSNRFLAYPYNFYVFPRNDLSLGLPASSLSCEALALEFLVVHGFDVNLCIHDGISYLSKAQEAEAKRLLASPFRLKSCSCIQTSNNFSDLVFSEQLKVKIEKWRKCIISCSSGVDSPEPDLAADFLAMRRGQIKDFNVPSYSLLSKCPSIALQLKNHHEVCLAQKVVEEHFKDLVPAIRSNCVSGVSHDVKIYFANSKEDMDIVKRELEDECTQDKIHEAVGFRHVIDAIAASQKPLIGHNCALDLAHIHSKFVSPLPPCIEEFSSSLLANFPLIVDTKCLLRFHPSLGAPWGLKRASLGSIYAYMFKSKKILAENSMLRREVANLSQRVHIDIMTGFKRYQNTDINFLHEAGYDAFMTGCIFSQMCQQLHINAKDLSSMDGASKFANMLSFGRSILDLDTGKLKETDGIRTILDEISTILGQDLKYAEA